MMIITDFGVSGYRQYVFFQIKNFQKKPKINYLYSVLDELFMFAVLDSDFIFCRISNMQEKLFIQ